MSDHDDPFENLARKAGAEVRRQPPDAGLRHLQRAQRRRRASRAGALGVAAVLVAGTGIYIGTRDDDTSTTVDTAVVAPTAYSVPTSPTSPAATVATDAPTTTPRAIIPVVPCFEQVDQSVPPPPVGSVLDTTIPEGGYVTGTAELVCGDERTAIIEGLLADVPVPAGFEVPDYGTSGPGWRSLIYEVSSAVVCAWLDEWFIAQAANDGAGMAAAAGALDTAEGWDMLNRDFMAYHAEYVQTWVDAVNGRGLIGPGGGLDVPPTRDLAESALVCTWRHR